MEINKIYHIDALKGLSQLKNNSVDLVITSPPYNMNLRIRNGKYCSRQITKEFTTKYQGFSDNLPIEEFYQYHSNVLKELLRVSNLIFYNIQIVTGSKRAFFKIIGDFNEYLKDIIVWDKGHAQPAMLAGVLNRQSELILVFEKDNAISRKFSKYHFERGTLNDIWKIPKAKKDELLKSHSAIFPEQLVETILLNFSNEKDLILDPFSGAGTTAVVSKKLNRHFIGFELLENYVNLANKRLSKI